MLVTCVPVYWFRIFLSSIQSWEFFFLSASRGSFETFKSTNPIIEEEEEMKSLKNIN